MPYRLSDLGERDLDEIWVYVAQDASATIADRLIDAIIDRFETGRTDGWVTDRKPRA